jgi:hypothetical protein
LCLSGFDVDRRYARRLSLRLRSGAGLDDAELAHLVGPAARVGGPAHSICHTQPTLSKENS